MSDELRVAAGVVGALVLCETVLPWAFTALRKWCRERAKGAGVPDALCPVPCAGNEVAVPCPPSSVREKAGEGQRQWPLDFGRTEELTEANRLWEEARGMTHRFQPDEIKDGEYLRKIQMAAELGHLEAMAKLGTYAFRRMRYVEAFYWRWRAEAGGWHGTEKPTLREIRLEWRLRGCPTEYDNDFGEERGKFARAVLRLQCGVDAAGARQRLNRLAERGVEEARLFLGK